MRFYKTTLSFLLAFLMVFSAGCGGSGKEEYTPDKESGSVPAGSETEDTNEPESEEDEGYGLHNFTA